MSIFIVVFGKFGQITSLLVMQKGFQHCSDYLPEFVSDSYLALYHYAMAFRFSVYYR